ncbi:hypothetical protein ACIHAA_23785 [Streptomyces sp. NPDC052040]|uniref:hypothetical protein n=1 Tax=unclassified Streptomyces TaxID=2593676 RepID=UPI0037D6644A
MTAFAVLGTPAAHAATRPAAHTGTFTIPAGQRSATMSLEGASVTVVRSVHASPKDATTCSVTAYNPYRTPSGGVGGGVGVSCNGRSASINVVAALYRNGSLITSSQVTVYNTTFGGTTAQTAYQSGKWKTGGVSTYVGYDGGATATDEKYSATVTL